MRQRLEMIGPDLAHARLSWLRGHIGVILALLVLGFLVLCALAPQWVASHDPLAPDLTRSLKPPSVTNFFGTDQLGRDIFSRVIHGTGHSLYISAGATLMAVAVGILLGLSSGAVGGWFDMLVMRGIDVLLAFPSLLMSMAVVAFLGAGSTNVMLAIAIAAVPGYARIVRAKVLVIRSSGYVEAARILGRHPVLILWQHILPNTIGPLIVIATLGFGSATLHAASLSYLGLGSKPPSPEWGLMLSEGQGYLRYAWWIGIFPGIFVTLSTVTITVLGRHIRLAGEGSK